MLKILNRNLFNDANRELYFHQLRSISSHVRPFVHPSGVELDFKKERCSKWKSYNQKKYPPLAPGETRPAYVCHVKEDIDYSYKKMWYVACFIRGMSITEALKQLQFVQLRGARIAFETLLEAQKLAVEEHNVEFETNLWVSESFVGKSSRTKSPVRYGRGRCYYLTHLLIHYFVTLEEGTPPEHYYYHKRPKTGDELLQGWIQEMRRRKIIGGL